MIWSAIWNKEAQDYKKLHEPLGRVQFVVWKIYEYLFIPNCTRKGIWLFVNNHTSDNLAVYVTNEASSYFNFNLTEFLMKFRNSHGTACVEELQWSNSWRYYMFM